MPIGGAPIGSLPIAGSPPTVTPPASSNPPFTGTAALAAIVDSWNAHPGDFSAAALIQPRELVPSSVDNPPLGEPDVWDLMPAVLAWQPAPPPPTELRKIDPGIPGQSVDNPPFVHPEREPGVGESVLAWQPRPPDPFMGGRQPLEARKLAPGVPGQSVDQPVPATLAAIEAAWQIPWIAPPPAPITSGRLAPGIPGQSVDLPPVRVSAALDPNILVSWIPPPPAPEPQHKLSPAIPGQSINQPVPVAPAVEPAVLVAWIPPPPAPILPKQNAPGVPGQSTDQPSPFRRKESPLWWIDPPLPTLATKLPPQLSAVAVNDPPFSGRSDMPTILAGWVPGPGAPAQGPKVPPPTARVDEPPYSGRTELPGIVAAWVAPVPLLLRAPSTPQAFVASQQPPFSLAAAVLAALYPREPILLPQARGALAPGIPGQSADNPPFGRRGEIMLTLAPTAATQPQTRVILALALPAAAPWLAAVLAAWAPPQPREQRRVFFPIIPPRADQPPPSAPAVMPGILIAWRPLPPAPILPPKIAAFPLAILVAGARIIVAQARVRLVVAGQRTRVARALHRARVIIEGFRKG